MKKMLVVMFTLLFAGSAFAADSSAEGTITLSGVLSPKVYGVEFAAVDCGAGKTYAECKTSLDSATFTGHANAASLAGLDLVEDGEAGVPRYIMFEMKSTFRAFKNDYVQIFAQTNNTNDIDVSISRLVFMSVGNNVFGQDTLGDTAGNFLVSGDAMLDDGEDVVLNGAMTTIWNQDAFAGTDVNGKVVLAVGANPLVVRGLLKVEYNDEATSDSFQSVITLNITVKDN